MRNFVYRVITDQEQGFGATILKVLLWVLSLGYCCVVAARNCFYDLKILRPKDLGKPAISVGNISWGGVGKTPFVILLAQHVSSLRLKPAILTRGYMDSSRMSSTVSDEATMIQQSLSNIVIGVGADRFKASQEILSKQEVDVFILDDGFQNRQVRRDLDIVLVDSTNPFGNGQLLPRGILRETLNSLKRAEIIVFTKSDNDPKTLPLLENRLRSINKACLFVNAVHKIKNLEELFSAQTQSLEDLRGHKIISFCSIADPLSFQNSLLSLCPQVVKSFVFPDHYVYSSEDIDEIVKDALRLGVDRIVTTAKDAVKIAEFKKNFGSLQCWVLNIEIELMQGKEKFFERINHFVNI